MSTTPTMSVDGLTDAQIAGAEAIIEAFEAEGLNPAGGIAVALNESGLNPGAVAPNDQGPGRNSTGLFQEGPGYGNATQLLDPTYNAEIAAKADAAAGGAGLSAGALQVLQTTQFERPANDAGDENPANLAEAETIVADLTPATAQVQAQGILTSYTGSNGSSGALSGAATSAASEAASLLGDGASAASSAVTDTVGAVGSALNWLNPASWVQSLTNWLAGKALLALASVALVALGIWLIADGAHRAFGSPSIGQLAGPAALAAAA